MVADRRFNLFSCTLFQCEIKLIPLFAVIFPCIGRDIYLLYILWWKRKKKLMRTGDLFWGFFAPFKIEQRPSHIRLWMFMVFSLSLFESKNSAPASFAQFREVLKSWKSKRAFLAAWAFIEKPLEIPLFSLRASMVHIPLLFYGLQMYSRNLPFQNYICIFYIFRRSLLQKCGSLYKLCSNSNRSLSRPLLFPILQCFHTIEAI